MLYFNNQELAAANHVSVRTVRNWIESASAGKLNLALHNVGERSYIANTTKNMAVIKELAEKNKKYRPHRSQKTVMPQSKFYTLYTQEQLYDLVSNLEINREIPSQYNYFGEGAANWDLYIQHLAGETDRNNLNATQELFELNRNYIDGLFDEYEQVNVVDVGVGNAMPTRNFLAHLLEQGKLGRYIALDISPAMLDIAENNIKEWFGDKVKFEKHCIDITHDRFGYILSDEYIKDRSEKTTNVMMFVGGTLQIFDKPDQVLEVLHGSMGVKDYLFFQLKLDTSTSRQYFDFDPNPSVSSLAALDKHIFELLNIDESFYDVEMGYDPDLTERYIRVRLKIALSIRFRFQGGERIVDFNKGDTIQLWRARHYNIKQVVHQLMANNLYPIQASHTDDKQFLLTISRIKRED